MTTLFAALTILAFLGIRLFAANLLVRNIKRTTPRGTSRLASRVFRLEDIDEVKKYAEVFGLDNHNITDRTTLLEMGRKVNGYLGEEKVEEIAELSRTQNSTASRKYHIIKSSVASHKVSRLVKSLNLSINQAVAVFMAVMMGGDRNDEEAINVK